LLVPSHSVAELANLARAFLEPGALEVPRAGIDVAHGPGDYQLVWPINNQMENETIPARMKKGLMVGVKTHFPFKFLKFR
jgi:hypothetical protein